MSDATPMTAADQEVLITRIVDAPRKRVFRAWTDSDQVAAWYGPEHTDAPRERIRIDPPVGAAGSSRWCSAAAAPSSRSATTSWSSWSQN